MMIKLIDAFNQGPGYFVVMVVLMTLLFVLIFEYFTMKNNQVHRQVSARIGKEEENRFDIGEIFLRIFHNHEDRIKTNLEKAHVLFTVKEYFTILGIAVAIGLFVGAALFPFQGLWLTFVGFLPAGVVQQMFGRIIAGSVGVTIGLFFPRFWLFVLSSRRRKQLAEQIPDALMNMADALKSGLVINEAIRSVGKDMEFPIGPEFARAANEMETGKPLVAALEGMKKRIDLADFTMAVNAIEIQSEVGGKLEPLLRNMVKIINERQELKREIEKTITNSKMIGYVLLGAPIFFLVVFSTMNADTYLAMLRDPMGIILLLIALVSYVIAAFIIFSIIRNVSKEAK